MLLKSPIMQLFLSKFDNFQNSEKVLYFQLKLIGEKSGIFLCFVSFVDDSDTTEGVEDLR